MLTPAEISLLESVDAETAYMAAWIVHLTPGLVLDSGMIRDLRRLLDYTHK